jgi:death on curing protein
MNYLTIDEVYAIHQRMIKIGGGRLDVHDFTLLHSAVERPKAMFGGHDLYPTIWEKGAALIHSLIKNHPFDDGNKRTAYYSTKRFFYINGFILNALKDEVIKFTVSIDVKNLTKDKISFWLKKHCVKI